MRAIGVGAALLLALAACGDREPGAESPDTGLENAATTGPSMPVTPEPAATLPPLPVDTAVAGGGR